MKMLKVSAVAAALLLGAVSGQVMSESVSASKATFAYNGLIALPSSAYTDPVNGFFGLSKDTGWTTVLRSKIKTANQKDLLISPALQCGLVTDTTVKSLSGRDGTAVAHAAIRVRVKVSGPEGVFYAEPNNTTAAATGLTVNTAGGLVYCDREQTLSARFSGLNCTAAPYEFTDSNGDGIDDVVDGSVTCTDPEQLQLVMKTLNANSFNFVAANVASGVHTIEVEAKTTADVGTDAQSGSLSGAEAFIGAGAVTVEEVRMIKGNTGVSLDLY